MTSPQRNSSGSGTRALGAGVIVLSVLWAYWPALRGGWLWDDDLEVAGNAVLRQASGWWKPWVAPAGMDYFPLKSTVQALEWHLWGGRVLGYHLAGVALHLLAAFLVWRLLARLFGPDGAFGAWFGGLVFALHPVAVESVAWIAEQKNTLSTVFCLLAALAYLRWRALTPARSAATYWGSWLLFLLALLCKSTVVMFPAVLLLHAWWRRGRIGRGDLRATLPFFAASLALGLVTLHFQAHRATGIGGPMPAFGPRLGQAGWSALAYLGECLWPSRLASIYLPIASGWLGLIPWLLLAALSFFLWSRRTTWGRAALAGLGWFYLNLSPVLGVLPMSYLRIAPRADHFAYLPLVGIAGLAGAAVTALPALWPGEGRRRLRLAGLAAVCAALAVASRTQAANYRDAEAYWTAAVGISPDSWLACSNLGRERLREGRLPEALSLFGEAISHGPPSAEVHANLGAVYERMGRAPEAQAQYEESVRLDPRFAGGHYNLGNLLLAIGEPGRAAEEFRASLKLDPASAMAHNNFGVALARQGRGGDALREYRAALKRDPALADAWVNLGNALFRLGRRGEAIDAYRSALAITPGNAAARHNLAAALGAGGGN